MRGMRAIVAMVVWSFSGSASADDGVLAARAGEVLRVHCAGCHGGQTGGDRGGFDQALDLGGVVRGGWVVPGDADDSELWQRLAAGEMPPASVAIRPRADEVAAVRAWIDAGAGAVEAYPDPGALAQWIADDLGRLAARDRRYARYVSVAHMPAAARGAARDAVAKLVNSLSWSATLHVPVVLGDGALVRIDLRALGWSRAVWERLARRAPGATVEHGGAWRAVHTRSGTYAPLVAGDWLVATASSPAIYHELLEVPADVRTLRRRLGVSGTVGVVRAGFNGSGVSQHNRLIEREPVGQGGYLWRSYDFESSQGANNLFENPLGPAGAGLRAQGGELIFSLPNGMQGYMLVDAAGRRIDRAPTSIVVDRRRADSAVQNGLSCMGCHDRGVIAKRDQLRGHVLRHRTAFELRDPSLVREVVRLHPPNRALTRVYAADRARFAAALARLGVGAGAEPIDAVARGYERDVDGATAARELGVDEAALTTAITRAGMRPRLGALMVAGGNVKRLVWDQAMPLLIDAMGRTRLARLPLDAELDLACDAGTGRDCYALADRFYRGRSVRADAGRALRLYRAACARDYGAGCTAVGLLVGRGVGGGVDALAAAQSFRRGCALGHARGCERLGRALLAGDGVAIDRRGARRGFAIACRAGRAHACTTLGDMHYHGVGGAEDHHRALARYRRGCGLGAARSCTNAAYLVDRGHGAAADAVAAAGLVARACRLGDAAACEGAGDTARQGRRVKRDLRLAAEFYERGCDLGRGGACRKLAQQYRWGQGVAIDWILSEQLFRRACKLGARPACAYM